MSLIILGTYLLPNKDMPFIWTPHKKKKINKVPRIGKLEQDYLTLLVYLIIDIGVIFKLKGNT